ncbi:MAG TPA: hypothetical protein VF717_07360 [Pyrinomonadaceae bacterium]|jgi:hypothetical protein
MAGWDGDALAGSMEEALEKQQEAAEARRAARKDKTSPEELERRAQEESKRLSRARIEEQLKSATNPAHRAMLERALLSLSPDAPSNDVSETHHHEG